MTLLKLFIKAIALTLLFLLIFLVLTGIALTWWVDEQAQKFVKASGTTLPHLIQTVEAGLQTQPKLISDRKNFLILGVDTLDSRGKVPPLTDTMMLASLNTKTGKVNLLPLPRDIYSMEYQTKINALLAYGQERNPQDPTRFPTEAISQMTGVPIHHTIVLSLATLQELIDLVGGVDITVPVAFTDSEFPRPNVDITVERDPAKLYQTVSFETGRQTMNGERALQYIRSRHAEGDQGSDQARSARQQEVIQAILTKIMSKSVLLNPTTMGNLYAFYQKNFELSLPLTEIIATTKEVLIHQSKTAENTAFIPTLNQFSLSIFPDDMSGAIQHPAVNPSKYSGQWVYEIRNPDIFKSEIRQKLYEN